MPLDPTPTGDAFAAFPPLPGGDTADLPPAELGAPSEGAVWKRFPGTPHWVEVPKDDDRELMSEAELSFHKAVAGNRAAAKQGGIDAAGTQAVLDAAAGPLPLAAGLTLQPITLGTLKALEKLGSAFLSDAATPLDTEQITLAIAIFANPRQAWMMLRDGKAKEFGTAAEDLTFDLDLKSLQAAAHWINTQLLSLNLLAGDGEDHAPPPPASSELGKPVGSSAFSGTRDPQSIG